MFSNLCILLYTFIIYSFYGNVFVHIIFIVKCLSKRATVYRDTKNNMLPTYRSLQNIAFTYIIVESESIIWLPF